MSNFKLKAGYIEYDVNFITYDVNGFVTSNCNSITTTGYKPVCIISNEIYIILYISSFYIKICHCIVLLKVKKVSKY